MLRRLSRELSVRAVLVMVPALLIPGFFLGRGEAASNKAPTAPAVVHCSRVEFSQAPVWTTSGAWSNGRLILVDSGARAVRQYLPSGRMVSDLSPKLSEDFGRYSPSRIEPLSGDRFLLEMANDRMVTFNKAFQVETKADVIRKVPAAKGASGARIRSLNVWAVATSPNGGEDEILGFGDISRGDQWQFGVFRFPISHPENFDILEASTVPPPSVPSRIFYRLGMHYLTAIGDTGYVLQMESRLGLFRNPKGSKGLEFVRDMGVGPILPNFVAREDLPSVMRAVEQSSMPVGIWGWEKYLFVLSREPRETGTRWTLTRLDLQQRPAQQVTGSVVLPTQAHHLTVVPGPDSWAFVEKGPVRSFGAQDIDSLVLVPAQALRGSLHARFVIE